MDDIIYEIGGFLSLEELFRCSLISRDWRRNLKYRKREIIKKRMVEISRAHYCNNICACFLENLVVGQFLYTKIELYICRYLKGGAVPEWFRKILPKKN